MIQRIQTIYLLAAVSLFSLMLTNPLSRIVTDEDLYEMDFMQVQALGTDAGESMKVLPVTILIFSIMAVGLLTIFLYRKRTLQMRLCMFNILLMLGLVGLIYFYTKMIEGNLNAPNSVLLWPIVVPPVSAVFTFLAMKAIQKDDALVKSYDRLR
jgi:D-alanyl-lipoteichoic acid acyltransferase DltB (MBOAT superfamily)